MKWRNNEEMEKIIRSDTMVLIKKAMSFSDESTNYSTIFGLEIREGLSTTTHWFDSKSERNLEYVKLEEKDSKLIANLKKRSK